MGIQSFAFGEDRNMLPSNFWLESIGIYKKGSFAVGNWHRCLLFNRERTILSKFICFAVGHYPSADDELGETEMKDYSEQIGKLITFENNLISARLGWILTANGFLYTAYAATIYAETQIKKQDVDLPHIKMLSPKLSVFLHGIEYVGLCMAIFTSLSIFSAYKNVNHYKRQWIARVTFSSKYPRPFADAWNSLFGRLTPCGTSVLLIWIWYCIIRA